ncbi:NAD(P)H oxidoreductase [Streptomyces sp. NPDC003042]
MSRTLLVVAHPRGDSLTAQVAERARRRAESEGNSVDLLDLYAEGFDPRLTPQDEPDWQDREKRYSPEVHDHMRRIEEADELVVVFPVWWFAPPAVVKGWIDRVWNYGFAYGRSKPRLAGKRMLWLGLAGSAAEYYETTGLGKALELQLKVGVSEFCGIGESAVRLLYGTEFSGIPETLREARARKVFATADEVLAEFAATAGPTPAAVPVEA